MRFCTPHKPILFFSFPDNHHTYNYNLFSTQTQQYYNYHIPQFQLIPNQPNNPIYKTPIWSQTFQQEVYDNNPSHNFIQSFDTQQFITFSQFSIKAIKQNTTKVAPPGRNSSPPGDSNQNKNIRSPLMSRLAVRIKPPGGFWEKPRNPIEQCRKTGERHVVSITKA